MLATATLLAALAIPQGASDTTTPEPDDIRIASAARADRAPEIDGRDTDPCWGSVPVITGFTEFQPNEGTPARYETEVRVAYNDRNLFVFVRAFDPEPETIEQMMVRRDQWPPSDHIVLLIDSYHDRRSGYEFGVNPSGSKMDAVITNDGDEDPAWDGVWDVVTTVDSLG